MTKPNERRAKRVSRQAGYSLKAAMDVLAGALKAGKGVAKSVEVTTRARAEPAPNKAQKAAADAFALKVWPEIERLEREGKSLRAIAAWLNDFVPTQSGGEWHAATVRNVKLRVAGLPDGRVHGTVETAGAAPGARLEPAQVEESDEPTDRMQQLERRAQSLIRAKDRAKELYADEMGVADIASILNQQGLQILGGDDWTAAEVKRRLLGG
jgi:hypothetical protein